MTEHAYSDDTAPQDDNLTVTGLVQESLAIVDNVNPGDKSDFADRLIAIATSRATCAQALAMSQLTDMLGRFIEHQETIGDDIDL